MSGNSKKEEEGQRLGEGMVEYEGPYFYFRKGEMNIDIEETKEEMSKSGGTEPKRAKKMVS